MKSYFKYCLIALPLLIVGCDLAKFPIDDPATVKIDKRLIGKWKEDGKGKHPDVYIVTEKDSTHYRIVMNNKKEKEADTCVAFLSDVRNTKILNVHYKKDSADGYLFIQIVDIDPAGRKVTAVAIKDSTMKNMVSAAMIREHVYNNLNDPDFYGDTVHLKKVR
jgi:hypothetical protein